MSDSRTSVSLVAIVVLSLLSFGCRSGETLAETEFSYSGVSKLTVEGFYFDVDISGDSGDTLDAEMRIPEQRRQRGVRLSHEKTGSEVIVRVERPRLSFIFSKIGPSYLTFTVPMAAELDIKTSSGSIDVAGISSDRVKLKASSGDVELRNSSGKIDASTSSGNIDIESSNGKKDLSSSSGNISVTDSEGAITADSSSGTHSYDGIFGNIAAESSSGNIKTTNCEGVLELRASSGDLQGNVVTITDDSSFRTSSGSVDFDFANDIDDFAFELKSSSGSISVGRTQAKGNVSTGNGDINISGKSSSGRQSYQ